MKIWFIPFSIFIQVSLLWMFIFYGSVFSFITSIIMTIFIVVDTNDFNNLVESGLNDDN